MVARVLACDKVKFADEKYRFCVYVQLTEKNCSECGMPVEKVWSGVPYQFSDVVQVLYSRKYQKLFIAK